MGFLRKLFRIFKPIANIFVDSLAENIAKNGGPILIEAAKNAVIAAATHGGASGEEKFNTAKQIVINELKRKGIPVVSNAVNGAIEAAVAEYNKSNR